MIKVVSFDLGKTLIKPVIQNSGLCKYIADNLKVSYMIMKPFYRSHFLERRISLSEFCAALGEDNQEKVLCLIENYYSEKKYNGIYEDVLPTLSKLKAKGYRLVCISNKPYCNASWAVRSRKTNSLTNRATPMGMSKMPIAGNPRRAPGGRVHRRRGPVLHKPAQYHGGERGRDSGLRRHRDDHGPTDDAGGRPREGGL